MSTTGAHTALRAVPCPRWLQHAGPAALLTLAAILPYIATLHYPFIYDDYDAIIRNPRLHALWPLTEPLTVVPETPLSSRPVAQLSLAINYAISGLEPWSYRAGNILLHAACVLLVWRLLSRLLARTTRSHGPHLMPAWLAFAVALLWAVHPLQTETVVYVTQRTELLVAFFLLTTIGTALRGFDAQAEARPTLPWYAAAAVFCWLGMATKEVMVGAPLLVLLIDRCFFTKSFPQAIRSHAPLYVSLFASWAMLATVVLLSPRSDSAGFTLHVTPLQYLFTQAGVILLYLKLSWWPEPLSLVYSVEVVSSLAVALPQVAIVGMLAMAAAVAVWRNRPIGVAGAWFFIILAPSSSIVPIVTEVVAERRMYLPLISVLLITLLAVWRILRAAAPRLDSQLTLALVATATAAFTLTSFLRLQDYSTEMRIWEDAIQKQPRSYMAHQFYGEMLNRQGEHELALAHWIRSVELNPVPELTFIVASMLAERDRYEEALHWLDHLATHVTPRAMVHLNRGAVLALLGREPEAEADFKRAIELEPGLAQAWLNLGILRARQGQWEEARKLFLEARQRDPSSPDIQASIEQVERDLAEQSARENGSPGTTAPTDAIVR